MPRLNSLIKFLENILILLRANKKKHLIVFGYSAFQGNLISKLKLNIIEFKNKQFLLFDFNRTKVGRDQFKNSCEEYSEFINYLGEINILTFLIVLIIYSLKRINILHGNYNSFSFKLLSFIGSKNISALDDGSNTLLMPFRIKRKFKNFYTIFPSILDNQRLKSFLNVIKIEQESLKKIFINNKIDKDKVFICGSADCEENLISEKHYLNLINLSIKYLRKQKFNEIIYYPHRRESPDKQKKISYLLKKSSSKILFPKLSFDDFYVRNNLNCSVVSLTSTLEKSLNYKLIGNTVNFIPIRYDLNRIAENYILEYSIISSSLSFDFSRDEILIFFKNKIINFNQLLESPSFKNKHFIEIRNPNIVNFVKKYYKNYPIKEWKGQMIYMDFSKKIYTLHSWKNFEKLYHFLQIAPDLMIGKY